MSGLLAGPANHRTRLAEVRDRKQALRDRIREAKADRDAARMALGDGTPDVHSESFRAAERAVHRLQAAERDLGYVEDEERFMLAQIAGVDGALDRTSWLHDPNVLRELQQLATSKAPVGNVNLGPALTAEDLVVQMEQSRMYAAEGQPILPPEVARRAPFYGIIPQLRRKLSLLDLIPTVTMELPVVPYVQESGSFDTAAETSELAVKKGGEAELTEQEAKAKTVAHWFKVSRQALADVAGLQSMIQQRLTYGVLRRLENQIVGGAGEGENLRGILHTSLVSDVEYSSGALVADLTAEGIVDVLALEGEADAIVMHPHDYFSARKAKASGSGEYLAGSPFLPTQDTLWDLPVIKSVAMPVGQAIVGDFSRGATVFVREGVNVRLSDSDQDDFLRNRCTLLGEGRFGLAIWQPRAFCVVHFQ